MAGERHIKLGKEQFFPYKVSQTLGRGGQREERVGTSLWLGYLHFSSV